MTSVGPWDFVKSYTLFNLLTLFNHNSLSLYCIELTFLLYTLCLKKGTPALLAVTLERINGF